MKSEFSSVNFTDAGPGDPQLAIQTCPGYDEAIRRARGNSRKDEPIRHHCPALEALDIAFKARVGWAEKIPGLEINHCPVVLCYTPYIDRLTVSGRCKME